MAHLAHTTDSRRASGVWDDETTGTPSGRVAILCAVAGFVLMAASALLFFAASGFSAQVNADPIAQLAVGGNSADLFRWASLLDMFGYLVLAPLALYLHHRFHAEPRIVLYTAAGFAYILIGAIGAIIFATAGAPLLRDYASATAAQRVSIATTYTTLYQIVVIGFWQTLEGIPGAVWLLGVGSLLFRARWRTLALVAIAFGAIFLLLAAARMLGL